MKSAKVIKFFSRVFVLVILAVGASFAADMTDVETKGVPTAEKREAMAQMHEDMAACLRSDKSVNECRDRAMENCPMMKDGKCSMEGMGCGMMKGKSRASKDHKEHH